MRVILIYILLFCCSCTFLGQSVACKDPLAGTKWTVSSIDSNGIILPITIDTVYYVQFNEIKNTYYHYRRRDKQFFKKNNYKEMAIHTVNRNSHTKYFCQIRAQYKLNCDNDAILTSRWDDHFKVQELFVQWNGKYSYWIWLLLNSQCIYEMTENELTITAFKFREKDIAITLRCVK